MPEGLRIDIFQNEKCKKEKFSWIDERFEHGIFKRYLEIHIGEICRKFKVFLTEGYLCFEPSEELIRELNERGDGGE